MKTMPEQRIRNLLISLESHVNEKAYSGKAQNIRQIVKQLKEEFERYVAGTLPPLPDSPFEEEKEVLEMANKCDRCGFPLCTACDECHNLHCGRGYLPGHDCPATVEEPACPEGYFWNGRQCLRESPWPAMTICEREGL